MDLSNIDFLKHKVTIVIFIIVSVISFFKDITGLFAFFGIDNSEKLQTVTQKNIDKTTEMIDNLITKDSNIPSALNRINILNPKPSEDDVESTPN